MIHTVSVLDPASLKSSVAVEAGSDTTALYIPIQKCLPSQEWAWDDGEKCCSSWAANLGWQKRKAPADRLILHFKEYLSVQMELLIPPHSLQPYYPSPRRMRMAVFANISPNSGLLSIHLPDT